MLLLHLVIDQVDAWAAGEREDAPAHDRQRAHRPGVAVAVAGGLPGGARHLPVRDRPDGRVPGLRLHLRLGRSSSSGSRRATRRSSSGSASASPRAAARSSAAGGSSRTATSRAGESFVRQALYGQRYLRETFGIIATTGANVDSFGHNASIPQILRAERHRLVRLPAARARRRCELDEPALLVGVARRLARARLPDPARVLRAEGRPRRARREGARRAAGRPASELMRLLRRRQPRRRADEGEPRPDRAAERARAACRGSSSARCAASSTASRARRRPPGASRRAPAPRARLLHVALRDQALEPARREPARSAPRSGARSPTSLGAQAVPARRS